MTWLYLTELTVIVTALCLLPVMKRAGEREWHRKQVRDGFERLGRAIVNMTVAFEHFSRAGQKMAHEMSKLARSLDRG